jgi:hypothetical protein
MARRSPSQWQPLGAAAAVAVTAVVGGAFYPGPRVAVGVALVLWVAWFALCRESDAPAPEEWALLALPVWGAVSTAVVGLAPLEGRLTVTGWLVTWCLWVSCRRSTSVVRELSAAVVTGAAVVVALGVFAEALGMGGLRVGGVLENPNVAAALLVAAVPLCAVVPPGSGGRWRVLVAAVLVGGVAVTGSRAGLLAVLAAGLVLLPRGRLRTAGLVAGGGAATALLAWRFVSHPEVLAWFRPAIWLGVVRLWAAHPVFGVGPGGLPDAAGTVRLLHADHIGHRQYLIGYAESTPLGLLVQTGTIGAVVVVVAIALWLRRARRDGALQQPALRAALTAVFVVSLFHDVVTLDVVLWWWAVVLGLLEKLPRAAQSTPAPRWLRGWLAMILGFFVLWGMVGPAHARWLWRSGPPSPELVDRVQAIERWYGAPLQWRVRQLLREPTWTWKTAAEALTRSRQSVRVHPGSSEAWMNRAAVQQRVIDQLGPWPDSIGEARASIARAAALEPYQPWPWLEAARLERTVGDLEAAAALARRAVDVEPHAVRAWLFLARVELDRGEVASARAAFDRARASADLRRRPGLTAYERELLSAPAWQFEELEAALP